MVNNMRTMEKTVPLAGIYKIELGNEVYIGSSVHLHERELEHRNGFQNGRGDNHKTKDMLDNGATFEVLEYIEDKEERYKRETYYIRKYLDDKNYVVINKFKSANGCHDIKANKKEYYQKNKALIDEKNKAYHLANKEKMRKYKAEWARKNRELHRDELNAYKREWRRKKKLQTEGDKWNTMEQTCLTGTE